MRKKNEFYQMFFERLARKGYKVANSESSDYLADIYYKGQLAAHYTYADTVIANPYVSVRDKTISHINDIAREMALRAGICTDCPYTEANEKMPNGSHKLAEYNGVTLACKHHHLFGYVFSTYRTPPGTSEIMQRQFFYNKDFAGQDFAKRSGLVDDKMLFSETELKILHSNLLKINVLDNNVSNDDRLSVGRIVDKIEEIMPELKEDEQAFDFYATFGKDLDFEIGG